MKYRCKICGYIYDDSKEKVAFKDLPDDWTCPLCGAPKSMFELVEDNKKPSKNNKANTNLNAKKEIIENNGEDYKLTVSELSALCSNLARGCEKQYKEEEMNLFKDLANYFDEIAPAQTSNNVDELYHLIVEDLEEGFPDIEKASTNAGDRGAQRVRVWGEKVTNMLKSLLDTYNKLGEKMFENAQVWVCSICGFVFIGENPPQICPVCKVPSWKFEKMEGRNNG